MLTFFTLRMVQIVLCLAQSVLFQDFCHSHVYKVVLKTCNFTACACELCRGAPSGEHISTIIHLSPPESLQTYLKVSIESFCMPSFTGYSRRSIWYLRHIRCVGHPEGKQSCLNALQSLQQLFKLLLSHTESP